MEERIRQQLGDKQPQEVSTVVGMYLGVQCNYDTTIHNRSNYDSCAGGGAKS